MAVQAGGHQGSGKCTTCAMADVTVRMAGGRPIRAVLVHLGFLVLVGVVTQMHALGRLLVLTVRRSRSPEGLQRQKHEQENGEPATHWNQHCRGAVYLSRAVWALSRTFWRSAGMGTGLNGLMLLPPVLPVGTQPMAVFVAAPMMRITWPAASRRTR